MKDHNSQNAFSDIVHGDNAPLLVITSIRGGPATCDIINPLTRVDFVYNGLKGMKLTQAIVEAAIAL